MEMIEWIQIVEKNADTFSTSFLEKEREVTKYLPILTESLYCVRLQLAISCLYFVDCSWPSRISIVVFITGFQAKACWKKVSKILKKCVKIDQTPPKQIKTPLF